MTKKTGRVWRWVTNVALFLSPLVVSTFIYYAIAFTANRNYIAGVTDGITLQKTALHAAIVENITYCESRNIHDRTSNKGAYGRAQFMSYTFDWMKKLAKKPNLQWRNEQDQMELLNWAIAHGYGSHWQYCYKYAVKKAAEDILKSREV